MKKSFILCVLLITISLFAVAQIKMLVHVENREPVIFEASVVDSITFLGNSETDIPGDDSDIPTNPDEIVTNGYRYVDLGLPSGTLWATMNVGAEYPDVVGVYFAWGEVRPKDSYTIKNYKWSDDLEEVLDIARVQIDSLTKYCLESKYGIVDNKIPLELSDDAAHVNWGGDWRMPSFAEINELFSKSESVEDNLNGVKGIKLTGPNGKSIFLPDRNYWTSTLCFDSPFAYSFYAYNYYRGRVVGQMRAYSSVIRPVINKKTNTNTLESEIIDYSINELYMHLEREHGYIYREGYWSLQENTTDECIVPTRYLGDWYDGACFWKLHNHRFTSQMREICANGRSGANAWGFAYSGVAKCNSIIDKFNLVDKDKIEPENIAEVHLFRAWYHYLLMDNFGNIPYTTEVTTNGYGKIQHTRAQVFDSIMSELNKYVPLASEKKIYTRINKYVGWMLLSKMYLNAEAWGVVGQAKYAPDAKSCYEKAAAYADSIINFGGYKLVPNYFTNFKIDNQGSTENIWSVYYDATFSTGMQFHMMSLHYKSKDTYGLKEEPWNGYCTTEKVLGIYEEGDTRIGSWAVGQQFSKSGDSLKVEVSIDEETFDAMPENVVKPKNWPSSKDELIALAKEQAKAKNAEEDKKKAAEEAEGKTYKPKYQDVENAKTAVFEFPVNFTTEVSTLTNNRRKKVFNVFEGPRFVKFQIEEGVGYHMSNDFPIYRLADVYLMKAEALMRANGGVATQEAVEAANTVRNRAGATAYSTKTLTLDELCNERCRELMWEGHRRQDLIRFGRFTGVNSAQNDSDPYNLWILKYEEGVGTEYDVDKESQVPYYTPEYKKIFPLPYFYIEEGNVQNPGYVE